MGAGPRRSRYNSVANLQRIPTMPTPPPHGKAILRGLLRVNVPVFVIMFGGWFGLGALLKFASDRLPNVGPTIAILLVAVLIVGPFLGAWLWWSFSIPKWRLWAMANTDDWPGLERAAIEAGLIWDENTPWGRFFAKTEIWSQADRQKEVELRATRQAKWPLGELEWDNDFDYKAERSRTRP